MTKKTKISRRLSKKLRTVFSSMKSRCENPLMGSYLIYGGRGIKCEWKSASEFVQDMVSGYREGLTIERINNEGNYCKGNCRWANRTEQANNRRSNSFVSFRGATLTLAQWGRKTGIDQRLIRERLKRGWSIQKAITTPDKTRKYQVDKFLLDYLKKERRWVSSKELHSHAEANHFKSIVNTRRKLTSLAENKTLLKRKIGRTTEYKA